MFSAGSLAQISGVTPLTFADEQLFRTAFSKHTLLYGHSWLYMLRAAHVDDGDMGYKYADHELVAAIGYRHDFIYVTPLFDATGGVKLRQLCRKLFKASGKSILIKKFQHQSFEQLSVQSLDASKGLPLEDDTCPETILHLQKFFVSAEGEINPIAKKLARRARAFERLGLEFQIVEDITKVPLGKLERFLAIDPEKHASYLPIVRYLHTRTIDRYKYRVMIFMHEGEIRGLYMTKSFDNELGLYGRLLPEMSAGHH